MKLKEKPTNENSKKKILILTRTLSRGGIANSLVWFLKSKKMIDSSVIIGIEINKTDLINEIDKSIEVVPYRDCRQKRIYKKLICFRDKIGGSKHFFLIWKLINVLEKIHTIRNIKTIFKDYYDVVIAFHQGNATKYASKYIKSKKRIYFYHSETMMPDCRESYFKKADRILCVSKGSRDFLASCWKHIDINKFGVCECLLDYKDIRLKAADSLSCVWKSERLLTVGRLVSDKGLDLLIESAKIIKEYGLDFTWLIVGDGPLFEDMQHKIKILHLEDNVILIGAVDNPYPLMSNCDIFVSTSIHEAYAIVIGEAKILNKIIVATRTSGARAHIQDRKTGFLTDFNAASIAKTIIEVTNNPESRSLIEEELKQIDYENINKKKMEFFENAVFGND